MTSGKFGTRILFAHTDMLFARFCANLYVVQRCFIDDDLFSYTV